MEENKLSKEDLDAAIGPTQNFMNELVQEKGLVWAALVKFSTQMRLLAGQIKDAKLSQQVSVSGADIAQALWHTSYSEMEAMDFINGVMADSDKLLGIAKGELLKGERVS